MLKSVVNFLLRNKAGNAILIIFFSLIVYSNTLDNSFHLDDYHSIVQDKIIKELGNFKDIGLWVNVNFRPLSKFSFALNYHLHGLDIQGYHWFNNIIHLISAIIVLLLSGKILDHCGIKNRYLSLFVALLFLVHPLQTQPVNYIVQRMTLLMGLFYLGSIYFYFLFREARTNKHKIIHAGISILFFLFSILSKQTAASIPLAWLMIEILFFSKGKRQLVFTISTILLIVVGLIVVIYFPPVRLYDTAAIPRANYLFTQFRVLLMYILMMFSPFKLNIDHSVAMLNPTHLTGYIYLLIHLSLLGIGFYYFKKGNPLLFFLTLWYYITSSIESSIFPIRDLMFEHRVYLGVLSYGYFIILIYQWIQNKWGKVSNYLMIMLLVILSFTSYTRNKVWKDEFSIWADAVSKSPDKDRPNYVHALNLRLQGKTDQSLVYFRRALAINPLHSKANNDLGGIYIQRNEFDKAEDHLLIAIKMDPDLQIAQSNMGLVSLYKEDYDQSIKYFRNAVKLGETSRELFNLGYAYHRNRQLDEAISSYRKSIRLDPDNFNSTYYLAIVYNELKKYKEAESLYLKCLSIQPGHKESMKYLANVYYYQGDYKKALQLYDQMLLKDSANSQLLDNRKAIIKLIQSGK